MQDSVLGCIKYLEKIIYGLHDSLLRFGPRPIVHAEMTSGQFNVKLWSSITSRLFITEPCALDMLYRSITPFWHENSGIYDGVSNYIKTGSCFKMKVEVTSNPVMLITPFCGEN